MAQQDPYRKPLDSLVLTVRRHSKGGKTSRAKGSLYLPLTKATREQFGFEEGETLQLKLVRRYFLAESKEVDNLLLKNEERTEAIQA